MVKIIPPKTATIIFIGILVLALLVAIVYWFFKSQEEQPASQLPSVPTAEEILNSLTAPAQTPTETGEEILESLSAPTGNREVSEEILQSLSAPQ